MLPFKQKSSWKSDMGGFKTKAEGVGTQEIEIRKGAVNSFHEKAHVFILLLVGGTLMLELTWPITFKF